MGHTKPDEVIIDDYASNLLSGRRFAWASESHASADRMTARGPISSRTYGAVVQALGKYAQDGDRCAANAHTILSMLPLYGTPGQFMAAIAKALHKIVANGYDDVIGATGPWAGRPSDHKHATTLRDAIMLDLLLVELSAVAGAAVTGSVAGIGWTLAALIRQENIYVSIGVMPNVHAMLNK